MNYQTFKHGEKQIFLIDMKNEADKIFSDLVLRGIQKYIKEKKKIAIIVNKKGYSSGIICKECGYIPKCENCDVSVSYHLDEASNYFGICHICKKTYNPINICPNCGGTDIGMYGIGTQKIKELIKEKFGKESLIIESETVNSPLKIKKIKQEIKNFDIIIGTSLLNNPIRDLKFDLIIFINADLGLNIPDYNSNYRNFLFLYETFQKHDTRTFLVQSFNPSQYSIQNACKLDFDKFKKEELTFRQDFEYPPYKEIAVILYKNEIEEKLFNKVNQLYQELLFLKEKNNIKDLEIFSTPPLIYKIFGKYRYNIILKGNNLKTFLDEAYITLKINQRGFKIDREPENIV